MPIHAITEQQPASTNKSQPPTSGACHLVWLSISNETSSGPAMTYTDNA
jgi:hypothetical protein